jgi:hypothetical protein
VFVIDKASWHNMKCYDILPTMQEICDSELCTWSRILLVSLTWSEWTMGLRLYYPFRSTKGHILSSYLYSFWAPVTPLSSVIVFTKDEGGGKILVEGPH